MISLPALIIAAVALFVIYLIKINRDRPENFPPGPPKLPVYGSYWYVLKENFQFAHRALDGLAKKYKTDILGFYLGDTPAVCTFSTELNKELLTKDEFYGKAESILTQARGNGKRIGIFFVDGMYWQDQRRFTLRHLRDYGFGRRSENFEQFTIDQIQHMMDLLLSDPRPENKDICRAKGEVLMPDIVYGYFNNLMWYLLSGRSHDLKTCRDLSRAALGFQRAGDVLGGAISITPWLRHIAPTFFGYTSAVEDNRKMYVYCEEIVKEHMATYDADHHRDFIDDYICEINKLESQGIYNTSFNGDGESNADDVCNRKGVLPQKFYQGDREFELSRERDECQEGRVRNICATDHCYAEPPIKGDPRNTRRNHQQRALKESALPTAEITLLFENIETVEEA